MIFPRNFGHYFTIFSCLIYIPVNVEDFLSMSALEYMWNASQLMSKSHFSTVKKYYCFHNHIINFFFLFCLSFCAIYITMCVIKCEGVFIKLILYNEWVYSYFSLGALIQEFFPRAAGGVPKSKVFDPLRSIRDIIYTSSLFVHGPTMREAERIRIKNP